jgi:formylglycine-generating enzyme required for sulfatase activity
MEPCKKGKKTLFCQSLEFYKRKTIMRFNIFTLIGLSIAINSFAQTTTPPNNMILVPEGDLVLRSTDRPVEALWVSHEITNKEYREFVHYIKANLKDSLCYFDLESEKIDSLSFSLPTIMRNYKYIKNAEIAKKIIDTTVFKDETPAIRARYYNYFNNPEFDNYPVVGVSYINAAYYCIWLTNMDMKRRNLRYVTEYRLPTEAEWLYTADPYLANKSKVVVKTKGKKKGRKVKRVATYERESSVVLMPVISGKTSKYGLYHYVDNVSEWISPSESLQKYNLRLIRGGSWKGAHKFKQRVLLDMYNTSDYVGFRVVRSVEKE